MRIRKNQEVQKGCEFYANPLKHNRFQGVARIDDADYLIARNQSSNVAMPWAKTIPARQPN